MFFAFAATFISAITLVIQKLSLSKFRVNAFGFNLLVFFFLALTAFIWTILNHSLPQKSFFQGESLILFIFLVFLAFIWNTLFSYSLQKEEMSEAEMIISMSPIFTVLLALILLPEERNYFIFAPALVASGALIWSNIEKRHFDFSKTEFTLLLAVLGIALEAIVIKKLLNFIPTETLYFLRCSFSLPLFALILLTQMKKKMIFPNSKKSFSLIALVGILATFQMVFFYRAYHSIGVTETILISLLAPILVFILTPYFFKEKIAKKLWFALAIILICIIISELKF